MSEQSFMSKTPSRLQDVKARVGHIPLIRRNLFVYGYLGVLVVFALFLLPQTAATPNTGQWISIALFVILSMAWAGIIFSDELKPEWFKTLTAFVFIGTSTWLYYRYSGAEWARLGHLFFNLKLMDEVWGTLFKGLWITVQIAIFAAIMSTIIGMLLAVFRSFNNRVLNIFIVAYIDFFRAMPIIVLMVLTYYALPYMGVRLSAMMSGIVALGINSSAYVAEIFRAGIMSVRKGQIEAARALGLNPVQTMRLVILPQAFRVVIPPLVGNYVASAKDTAICSAISISELLKSAISEQALRANPSPLIFVTLIYLMMFVPLTRLSGLLETRMKASSRKSNV
jgi:polar amino acid transport system permease protein